MKKWNNFISKMLAYFMSCNAWWNKNQSLNIRSCPDDETKCVISFELLIPILATWCMGHINTRGSDQWPVSQRFYELMIQISFTLKWKMIIQTGQNFAHATTAELSWHAQNSDLIGSLESILEWKEFPQDFNYELINGIWIECHRKCPNVSADF